MRTSPLLSIALLASACEKDLVGELPDAAPPDALRPSDLLEMLVAGDTWVWGMRNFTPGSVERVVVQARYVHDPTCDCVRATTTFYQDVVAPGSPLTPGAVACEVNQTVRALPYPELDPLVRTIVEYTFTSALDNCVSSGDYSVVLDAPPAASNGLPPFISWFIRRSPGPNEGWPGWRERGSDYRWSIPYMPCAEADRVPGRAYCMPACDWETADPGRPLCGFPSFDPPFPTCNAVAQISADVAQQRVAATAPTPLGGTPLDGTYQLTSWTLYTGTGGATGPTGEVQAMTANVHGSTIDIALHDVRGTIRLTLARDPAISPTAVTQQCPDFDPLPADSYTVAGDVVTLYGITGALELTRMP